MNNINEQSIDFYKKFQEIKYDMSKASLEDVKNILDHYNQGSIMVDGVNYHYNINPLDAACLNARYKELTGQDHPIFVNEQGKVLDEIIKSGDGISVDGKPTIYQRLKNNLTGEGLGISILPNKKDSYIDKFNKIKSDMSQASLEDVTDILDHYDQDSVLIDGMQYHFRPNALQGASLNARYKELTGQDHPTFLKAQEQILEKQIKDGQGISVNGNPTVYEQLKNNLTGEGLGISILPNKKDSYIDKFNKIKSDMSQASLEDVTDILDHYDQDSVLIDGMQYHFRPNALQGASLNARYKELTGQDHPTFLKAQEQILEKQIKDGQGISVNGNPTVYEQLKNNNMSIGNHNHILNRTTDIILNPQEASLEDISSLLNYYNGKPVLIDGVAHHPFNDPMSAAKLNARYKELTGQDHPIFTEQVPKVINELMKNKDMLVQAGAYGIDYFDKLEQIKNGVQPTVNDEESKKLFVEEREKQRQLDASVRKQQFTAMQKKFSEATQDNSIGGMNR